LTKPLITARKIVRAGLYQPYEIPRLLDKLRLDLETHAKLHRDPATEDLALWLGDELERWRRSNAHVDPTRPGPTPETRAKLRRDPVQTMIQQGTLGGEDLEAVALLNAIRKSLSAGLTPFAADLGAPKVDMARGYRHPVDRMGHRMALILAHVYRPWARAMGESVTEVATTTLRWHSLTRREHQLIALTGGTMDAPVIDRWEFLGRERPRRRRRAVTRDRRIVLGKRRLSITRFQLVFQVIEEGTSLRHLERLHRVRSGMLGREFTIALRDFARRMATAVKEGLVSGNGKTRES